MVAPQKSEYQVKTELMKLYCFASHSTKKTCNSDKSCRWLKKECTTWTCAAHILKKPCNQDARCRWTGGKAAGMCMESCAMESSRTCNARTGECMPNGSGGCANDPDWAPVEECARMGKAKCKATEKLGTCSWDKATKMCSDPVALGSMCGLQRTKPACKLSGCIWNKNDRSCTAA